MSGTMPGSSKLKKAPVRPQPAWMSSRISRMPRRRGDCARGAAATSRRATLMPPSPCTVSTITAAGRSRPDARVVEQLLEQVERVDLRAEVAVEGQARDVVERRRRRRSR